MSEKTRTLCLQGEAAFPNAASRRAGTSPRRSTLQSWAPGALGMQPLGQGGHLVLAMPPQMTFSIRKVLGECWAWVPTSWGVTQQLFPCFAPRGLASTAGSISPAASGTLPVPCHGGSGAFYGQLISPQRMRQWLEWVSPHLSLLGLWGEELVPRTLTQTLAVPPQEPRGRTALTFLPLMDMEHTLT